MELDDAGRLPSSLGTIGSIIASLAPRAEVVDPCRSISEASDVAVLLSSSCGGLETLDGPEDRDPASLSILFWSKSRSFCDKSWV
jgi:hypothetical protein